jgi:NAD(P)-dependent dehydrogenase (short-subunit alcohol dehydrogenase family)
LTSNSNAFNRGIGLETCILFAKEGANVLMADISGPALEKASAKLKQLVPSYHKVEIQVISKNLLLSSIAYTIRCAMCPKKPTLRL